MAGIAGKVEEGSQSIVLAGGYKDDEDNGDLSSNKRTAKQSSDQKLDRRNGVIVKNYKAP